MQKNLNIFLQSLLVTGFYSIIALVIWGINKGFDLSDEGYYILGLIHPYDSIPIMEYQKIVSKLLIWLHPGIIEYRIIRLFLTIISSLFFSWTFFRWLKAKNLKIIGIPYNFLSIACFIGIGSMLSYSISPQTLSYNSITLIVSQFVAGLILFLISSTSIKKTIRYFVLILLGITVGFEFFVKYPASLIFIFIIILILIFNRWNLKQKLSLLIANLICFSIGLFIMLIYYSLTEQSFLKYLFDLTESMTFLDDHDVATILTRYFYTTLDAFHFGVLNHFEIPVMLIILIIVQINLTEKSKLTLQKYLLMFELFIISWILYTVTKTEWWKSGMIYYYRACDFYFLMLTTYLILISVPYFLIKKKINIFQNISDKREIILVGIVLLVLPVACSFGTYNDLPLHILQYLFAWFGLFILLSGIFLTFSGLRFISISFLCIISIVGVFQNFTGFAIYPYRLEENLFAQNEEVDFLPNAKGIKLDIHTKERLKEISDILKYHTHFRQGDPIIPIYSSPGLVYLLGGISPSSGWYRNDLPVRNCYNVLNCKYDLSKTIILNQEGFIIQEKFLSCMKQKKIFYPDEYIKIATVPHHLKKEYNFNIDIWIPKTMLK